MNEEFLSEASPHETGCLLYVGGYKYQARNAMVYNTGIRIPDPILTPLITMRTDGYMRVSPYFAWDGCSGPTWDDRTNMRAGHCHDALYALIRMGLLPLRRRPECDAKLKALMISDGAYRFRAEYYEWAVNHFGEAAATKQRPVMAAP